MWDTPHWLFLSHSRALWQEAAVSSLNISSSVNSSRPHTRWLSHRRWQILLAMMNIFYFAEETAFCQYYHSGHASPSSWLQLIENLGLDLSQVSPRADECEKLKLMGRRRRSTCLQLTHTWRRNRFWRQTLLENRRKVRKQKKTPNFLTDFNFL